MIHLHFGWSEREFVFFATGFGKVPATFHIAKPITVDQATLDLIHYTKNNLHHNYIHFLYAGHASRRLVGHIIIACPPVKRSIVMIIDEAFGMICLPDINKLVASMYFLQIFCLFAKKKV